MRSTVPLLQSAHRTATVSPSGLAPAATSCCGPRYQPARRRPEHPCSSRCPGSKATGVRPATRRHAVGRRATGGTDGVRTAPSPDRDLDAGSTAPCPDSARPTAAGVTSSAIGRGRPLPHPPPRPVAEPQPGLGPGTVTEPVGRGGTSEHGAGQPNRRPQVAVAAGGDGQDLGPVVGAEERG